MSSGHATDRSADRRRILSWRQVGGMLVAAVLTIYLLWPDAPTLLEDLIRDGKVAEAERVLRGVTEEARAKEPLRYAMAEQRVARLRLGGETAAEAVDYYVVGSARRWRAHGYAAELLDLWIGQMANVSDVMRVWAEVAGDWEERVPGAVRERLEAALVARALATDRARLAAGIFAVGRGTAPTEAAVALELARLHRLGGDTRMALASLRTATGPAVEEMRITLWRELNRNEEALAVLLRDWTPERTADAAEVARLAEVARAAGRSGEAVAVARSHAVGREEDIEAWRRVVMLERESGAAEAAAEAQGRVVRLSGRAADELREWGRLLEGAGRAGEAFGVWYELGMQQDLAAVDRLIALNPGLYRGAELAEVLLRNVPVPGHDDYTLVLARLLAEKGRYDEAVGTYERYLAVVPRDTGAMVELAVLEGELYRYASAAGWLERAVREGGSDVEVRRRLAGAWMGIEEFGKALDLYRTVAEETKLPGDYGAYFRLARGMGENDDFVAGLRGVTETAEAVATDYLTLAYGLTLMGREGEARETLAAGVARFPEEGELALRYAYALANERRYREAQAALAGHPRLTADLEAARFYFSLMRINNDLVAERAFLGRELATEVAADAELRRLRALALMAVGEWGEAVAVLEVLQAEQPGNWDVTGDYVVALQRLGRGREAAALLKPLLASGEPAAWRLAAEVATSMGRHRDAEGYQQRYLALADPVRATDWGALGDIRLSRGDRIGAKRAYQRALRVMQLALLDEGGTG